MTEPDVEPYMTDLLRVLPGAESGGSRVYHSSLVPAGQVIQVHLPGYGTHVILGTRPLTVLEEVRREARQIVRDGLVDVLEWLGQSREIGPPTASADEVKRLYALLDLWKDRAVPVEAREPYRDYALERGIMVASWPRPEAFVYLDPSGRARPARPARPAWWDPFAVALMEGASWAKD